LDIFYYIYQILEEVKNSQRLPRQYKQNIDVHFFIPDLENDV